MDRPGARADVAAPSCSGLAEDLAPATRDLAKLTDASIELLPQTDLASMCARDVVLPTGDVVIHDEFHDRAENYKEFW